MNRDCENVEHVFQDEDHSRSILSGLTEDYVAQRLCDMTLCVDEVEILCHKVVLKSFSSYFKAMLTGGFSESQQNKIVVKGVSADVAKQLIEFAYTSKIRITEANVQALLCSTNMWQILSVHEECGKYLWGLLDASNCLDIKCLAEVNNCSFLEKQAMEFALRHFAQVITHEEFLQLKSDKLIELVSSDDLNVTSEEVVFKAVMLWYNHKPVDRAQIICQILKHIRFPYLTPEVLVDEVESQSIINDCPKCRKLVQEAKNYQLLPDRQSEMISPRTKTRTTENILVVNLIEDRYKFKILDTKSLEIKSMNPSSSFTLNQFELAVAGNDVIYIIGVGKSKSFKTWKYNLNSGAWVELAKISMPLCDLGLVILEEFLYVVGGKDSKILTAFQRYNTKTNSWKILAPMRETILKPSIAVCCGELYVTDIGEKDFIMQNYNPKTNKWTVITLERTGGILCALSNKLYLLGGFYDEDDLDDSTNLVDCYDPIKKEWQPCAPMKRILEYQRTIAVNDKIYVCGTETDENESLEGIIQTYDAVQNKWNEVELSLTEPVLWSKCSVLRTHPL